MEARVGVGKKLRRCRNALGEFRGIETVTMATMARCTLKPVPLAEHFPRPGERETRKLSSVPTSGLGNLREVKGGRALGWRAPVLCCPPLLFSVWSTHCRVSVVAGGWLDKFQASHGGDYL